MPCHTKTKFKITFLFLVISLWISFIFLVPKQCLAKGQSFTVQVRHSEQPNTDMCVSSDSDDSHESVVLAADAKDIDNRIAEAAKLSTELHKYLAELRSRVDEVCCVWKHHPGLAPSLKDFVCLSNCAFQCTCDVVPVAYCVSDVRTNCTGLTQPQSIFHT